MTDTKQVHTALPWAIKHDWSFEPVQIIKVSKSRTYYIERWGGREREKFCDSSKILPWRGDETGARKLVDQLTSAQAEYNRRRSAAQQWFNARVQEIAALSQAGGASD